MAARVHPRWNRETRESEIFFTDRTLSRNRILRLSNGATVGLIAGTIPSSESVLTVKRFRTTSAHVATSSIVLSTLLAELALRQLPCGGWSALASSSQPAIEPTCYSALA